MNNEQKNFLSYSLFAKTLEEAPSLPKTLINTINQYSYCIAEQDLDFKRALQNSDILLPDGIAIVAALRLLTGQKIKKIAGADAHQYLLNQLNIKGGNCFYLGSSANTLQKIKEKISVEYPNITVGNYSPPYKSKFNAEDISTMIHAVNASQPDVLFIGMTAPKQEKWAYAHKEHLQTKVICTIGAVFDFYAGTIERPDKVWINLGLEWLVRLIKEPKRMWKRYLYYGPVFIYLMCKEKVKRLNKK